MICDNYKEQLCKLDQLGARWSLRKDNPSARNDKRACWERSLFETRTLGHPKPHYICTENHGNRWMLLRWMLLRLMLLNGTHIQTAFAESIPCAAGMTSCICVSTFCHTITKSPASEAEGYCPRYLIELLILAHLGRWLRLI
jgi:hypothetical protein